LLTDALMKQNILKSFGYNKHAFPMMPTCYAIQERGGGKESRRFSGILWNQGKAFPYQNILYILFILLNCPFYP